MSKLTKHYTTGQKVLQRVLAKSHILIILDRSLILGDVATSWNFCLYINLLRLDLKVVFLAKILANEP